MFITGSLVAQVATIEPSQETIDDTVTPQFLQDVRNETSTRDSRNMDELIVATTETPLLPEGMAGPSRDQQHEADGGAMPTGGTATPTESVDQRSSQMTGSTLPPPYSRYSEGRSALILANMKSLDCRL